MKGAARDFSEIADFYALQSESASKNFLTSLGNCVTLLQKNPFIGIAVFWFCRKIVLKKFPYCVYYKVNENEQVVEIVAIIHHKRGLRTIQKKLKA
jgi:plasmid stabilization system protein ParE